MISRNKLEASLPSFSRVSAAFLGGDDNLMFTVCHSTKMFLASAQNITLSIKPLEYCQPPSKAGFTLNDSCLLRRALDLQSFCSHSTRAAAQLQNTHAERL